MILQCYISEDDYNTLCREARRRLGDFREKDEKTEVTTLVESVISEAACAARRVER